MRQKERSANSHETTRNEALVRVISWIGFSAVVSNLATYALFEQRGQSIRKRS